MKLIIYILLLACAAWGGVLLRQDPGVVLLSGQNWSVEMPMWLAIVFILLSLGIILVIVRLLNELFAGYYNSKNYFRRSKKRQAKQRTGQALLQLAESQWALAEKNAIKGAAFSDLPFINYISAAKAAHEQSAWERRDRYLALAAENAPEGKLASGIIKAKLQYKQGDLARSLATLQDLKGIAPKHPLVLKLLGEVYEKTENWTNLLHILPELKKYNSCPKYMLQEFATKAYQGLLLDKTHKYGKQELLSFWKEIPTAIKINARVIETYVSCLCKLEANKEASEILKNFLKKYWDKRLVRMYGFIQGAELGKQIFIAEKWLNVHPGDPALLLTLARLCLRNQLWGKAKDYLEMSIQLEANPEAYAELGRLLDHLGEAEKCQDCYRKGLLTVTDVLNLDK